MIHVCGFVLLKQHISSLCCRKTRVREKCIFKWFSEKQQQQLVFHRTGCTFSRCVSAEGSHSVESILSIAQAFCGWSCVWANWNNIFFSSPKGTTECPRWYSWGLASLPVLNDSASDVKNRFPSERGSKFDGELILRFLVSNGEWGVISPVLSGKTNRDSLRNII